MTNPLSEKIVTIQPSGIRRFFDIVSEMEGAISLGVGEPDFDTPWHIREEGIYSLEKGRTFYTSNSGLKGLKEEICNYLKRRCDLTYDPEHEVLVTVGGSEAIDIALRAMLDPGDEVLIRRSEKSVIMADMGAEPSLALVRRLKERSREEGVTTPDGLMPLLEQEVEAIFKTPRRIAAVNPPEVILMVGVNGVGKTTTIAKLAYRARMQGKKVLIAAADTFRAAAVEQLEVWARRIGADFHSKGMGADPAAVAFEAMDKAMQGGYDVLFIDTAGRLHTKSNLMDELHKIRMVVERKLPGAPHRTILVIDATTGQNALQQTKMFKDTSGVNEIILTKLDGTAKGGVALAVASQFELPITFIGLGEKMEDLRPFDPHDFARALLGKGEE